MSELTPDFQKQLATRIAAATNEADKEALQKWIAGLLTIRAQNTPPVQKAKEALALTARSKVVLPTVKMMGRELKRVGWNERGLKGRLGVSGAAAGILLFGSQGAGIAALGTAFAVPLWVVFGAGAAFLGVLYEEITSKKSGD